MSDDSGLLQRLQTIRQNYEAVSESDSDESEKPSPANDNGVASVKTEKKEPIAQKDYEPRFKSEPNTEESGGSEEDDAAAAPVPFELIEEDPCAMKGTIPRDIFFINDKTGKLQLFKTFEQLSEYLVETSISPDTSDEGQTEGQIEEKENFTSKILSIPLGSMVHHVTMGKYLRHLYEKDQLMDVNVEVGTENFKAHRIALSCYSKYFADLFSTATTMKCPVNVKIKGINETSFAAFLEFVYTGEVSITPEIAADFLVMAEYLKVPGLQKRYGKIIDILKLENVVKILVRNKDGHAYKIAFQRAIREFVGISSLEAFLDIEVDLVCLLLESDNLNVRSEYQVFSFMIRWISHNIEDRLKYAARILSLVRFTCMTQTELFMCSETTGLIRGYDKFREHLLTSNWVLTADQLHRQDQFGFPRHSMRVGVNSQSESNTVKLQTLEGHIKYPRFDPKDHPRMPAPLMTSSPRPCSSHKYAKPVMAPPEMQTPAHAVPQTVDILVVGGFQVESSENKDRVVECYDVEGNQWVYYSNLQEPRRHHAVTTLDGKLYLLGGCSPEEEGKPSSSVYVMDLVTKQWSKGPDMNNQRQQHCACVLDGKIYVVGGVGLDGRVLETVECYNPADNTWSYKATLEIPVYSAAAAVLHDRMYVAGGITEATEPFSKKDISPCVISYSPKTNSWVFHNDMRFPRCRAEMVNVGERLFLCGGATLSCNRYASRLISLSSIDEYVEKHDMWCHLSDLIIPRHDIGVAVAGDRIYIIGGVSSTANRVLQSIECFDTRCCTWLSGVQDLPYPTQWLKCASVVTKWQRSRRHSQ